MILVLDAPFLLATRITLEIMSSLERYLISMFVAGRRRVSSYKVGEPEVWKNNSEECNQKEGIAEPFDRTSPESPKESVECIVSSQKLSGSITSNCGEASSIFLTAVLQSLAPQNGNEWRCLSQPFSANR
jgi:hypothetical protein